MGNALPGAAEAVAHEGDHRHPDCRADQAQDPEQAGWHLDEASDQRDEGPDNGKGSPERDGEGSAADEEAFGPVQVGAADEQIPAKPLDERSAADAPDVVREKGTDEFCDRANEDYQDDIEVALVGEDAGEAEGDLRRNRDAGCLEESEQEDRGQAPLADEALHRSLLYSMRRSATDHICRAWETLNRRLRHQGGRRSRCGRPEAATPWPSSYPGRGRLRDTGHNTRQGAERYAYRDPRGLRANARPGKRARLRLPGDQRDVEPDTERGAARLRRRGERRYCPGIHWRCRLPVGFRGQGHGHRVDRARPLRPRGRGEISDQYRPAHRPLP